RTLRLVIEHRVGSQLAESSKLNQERTGLGRIAYRRPHFASAKIAVSIRHASWRLKDRQQTSSQIFRQGQESLIAGQLIVRQQPTKQPNSDLKVLNREVFFERHVFDYHS